jgi:hypothetical protein
MYNLFVLFSTLFSQLLKNFLDFFCHPGHRENRGKGNFLLGYCGGLNFLRVLRAFVVKNSLTVTDWVVKMFF